jgi:hypothetical protein
MNTNKIYAITEEHLTDLCQIVSHPSGNCPYFLIFCDHAPHEGALLVEDTAEFFKNYDLSENTDENI